MSESSGNYLFMTLHSILTPEGRELLGTPDTLQYFKQILATRKAKVAIGQLEVRVDLYGRARIISSINEPQSQLEGS